MFQRIDFLPQNTAEREKARSRWESEEGRLLQKKILKLIREGAGEDFLQYDFEAGHLGFLNDQWDLAGLDLFNEEITFPRGDNFENIDFSYNKFWHCIFINATFPQTTFRFVRLYNVEFRNCLFAFTQFYGTKIEKCRFIACDFVEENGFINCEIFETEFLDCFFNKNKFNDCKFDEGVSFNVDKQPQIFGLLSQTSSGFQEPLKNSRISGIYRGIKEGFLDGKIYSKSRYYFFLQQQTYTRFNRAVIADRAKHKIWELLSGYGLRPMRVLLCLIFLFTIVFVFFTCRLGSMRDSLIFSSGAFLTFGAKAEVLNNLSLVDHFIYIISAFSGVALIALFITVMANVLLKDY